MNTNFFNSSKEIKEFLIQRMETLGINQNQLAKKLNKNSQEISYFFNKKKQVTFEEYLLYNSAIEEFTKKDLPINLIQNNNDNSTVNSQVENLTINDPKCLNDLSKLAQQMKNILATIELLLKKNKV